MSDKNKAMLAVEDFIYQGDADDASELERAEEILGFVQNIIEAIEEQLREAGGFLS